jgi:hypothetical protein
MKTKSEIIAELKSEHPTLRDGSEELGYRELTSEQYEDTIERWAGWILSQEELEAAQLATLAAKAAAEAKLAALGLTTDDLKALGLGGN